jgi:uncharacterized membrane-anchored protein YhcB (DUF1043 family)
MAAVAPGYLSLMVTPRMSRLESLDSEMGEASAVDLVAQPVIECQVPRWLYNAYNHLEENINHFHELVNELESKGRRLKDAFPQLASLYTGLLNNQKTLYALASSNAESLQNAQQEQFLEMKVSSDQFATQVSMAMQAANAETEEQFRLMSRE